MTLPANPPISLAQVRAEFGAPVGTPLHDFHRGGPWVPNTSGNSGVPTSGNIRLAQLCGSSKTAPLSVSLSPSALEVEGLVGGGGVTATLGPATVSVSGGSGTISYSWEYVSGDTIIHIVSPTSASTKFTRNISPRPNFKAFFRCKVTRGSETAYTGNVSVWFH